MSLIPSRRPAPEWVSSCCHCDLYFRHRSRNLEHPRTRLLEIRCGAGNNLWFAAREESGCLALRAASLRGVLPAKGRCGPKPCGARAEVGSLTFCGPQKREHWFGKGGTWITRKHVMSAADACSRASLSSRHASRPAEWRLIFQKTESLIHHHDS